MSRKFSELIPEESLADVYTLVKNLFTVKIPNLQLVGRLAHFGKSMRNGVLFVLAWVAWVPPLRGWRGLYASVSGVDGVLEWVAYHMGKIVGVLVWVAWIVT